MKEQLAERLLARVMNWSAEDVARERPLLQALAGYKYDEYQQFSHGLRFIESLALWLNDMKNVDDKTEAYRFVRDRLVFFSFAEMQHLISIAYPDYIRPQLVKRLANQMGRNPFHRQQLVESPEFKIYQRSCLFLGLSDGARTDLFRRANDGDITHEQILQTYEVKPERVTKLLEKLQEGLKALSPDSSVDLLAKFQTIVLLDDFSASGTSYLNPKQGGKMSGKLSEFASDIFDSNRGISELFDTANIRVFIVLYIATDQAVNHITGILNTLWKPKGIDFEIIVIHPLAESIRIQKGDVMDPFLGRHYDEDATLDEHEKKGGDSVKYGYANCGLPVVLSHNTPNNSIYPLWKETKTLRPLFPRVIRHKAP